MLPNRRDEFAQWIGGVVFTVGSILALAYWLQGGWDASRPARDSEHVVAPAQPRVPASNSVSGTMPEHEANDANVIAHKPSTL